jgi:hypothetical protein
MYQLCLNVANEQLNKKKHTKSNAPTGDRTPLSRFGGAGHAPEPILPYEVVCLFPYIKTEYEQCLLHIQQKRIGYPLATHRRNGLLLLFGAKSMRPGTTF